MRQSPKHRLRPVRSGKRYLVSSEVEKVSLMLIGGLLIILGMMLRG